MLVCTHCHAALADGASHCAHDGSAGEEVASSIEAGATFAGRFTIVAPAGAGGTGFVYRATDGQSGGRDVALKIFRDDAYVSPSEKGRVKRELGRLPMMKHPNIATVLASGEEQDGAKLWLAREWIDGENVAALVGRDGALPLERIVAIGSAVCATLVEAHKLGVLHRDLKPAHVLLAGDSVKVIDFGVPSKIGEPGQTRETFGTLPYVAPEQAAGKLTTFRADLYSLGALFYEMLAGQPHVEPKSLAEFLSYVESAAAPEPVSGLGEKIPDGLLTQVRACLQRDMKERPLGAKQVREVIGSPAETAATAPTAPPPAAPAPPPRGLGVPAQRPATAGAPLGKTIFGVAAGGAASPDTAAKTSTAARTTLGLPAVSAEEEAEASASPATPPQMPSVVTTQRTSAVPPAMPAGAGVPGSREKPGAQAPGQMKPTMLGMQAPPGMGLPARGTAPGAPRGAEWAKTVLGIPQGGSPPPPSSPTPVMKPEPQTETGAYIVTDSMMEPMPQAPGAGPAPAFEEMRQGRVGHDPNVDSMAMTMPMMAVADAPDKPPARPVPPTAAGDSVFISEDLMADDEQPRLRARRRGGGRRAMAGAVVIVGIGVVVFAMRGKIFGTREISEPGAAVPVAQPTPSTPAAPAPIPPTPAPTAVAAANPSPAPSAPPTAGQGLEAVPPTDTAPLPADGTLKAPPRGGIATLLKTGGAALHRHDFDTARRSYADAIRFYPQSGDGYAGMGDVAVAQQRFDEAVRQYRRAVQLKPQSAPYHSLLAGALLHTGDRGEALAEVRRSLQVNSRYAPAKRQLAQLVPSAAPAAPAKAPRPRTPPRKRR